MKKKRQIIFLISLLLIASAVFCSCTQDGSLDGNPFSELNYVAFGDSITNGADPKNNLKDMRDPYPELVGKGLGVKNVYNYAVNGSTLTYVDERYNILTQVNSATSNADIVSVMIGVNDYYLDVSQFDFNASLNELILSLKSKYPNSFIFFMTPYMAYSKTGENASGTDLSSIAAVIKDECAKHSIPVLDLYTNGNFDMVLDPDSDGLHPTQEFIKSHTSPQIEEFIRNNYLH